MSLLEKTRQFFGFEEELLEGSPLYVKEQPRRRVEPHKKASVIDFSRKKAQMQNHAACTDMMVIEPQVYEDSMHVSSYIKRGNPVVVNIKHLDAASGKRFIDFVCGSAYAFEGHMHRLGGTIFLFTPSTMGIIVDEQHNTMPREQYKSSTHEEIDRIEYFDSSEAEAKEVFYA